MCTVSVKVNVALLRGMRPELNTTAAIRQWAQQQIDLRIQQMETELGRNESQEDLWHAIEQDEVGTAADRLAYSADGTRRPGNDDYRGSSRDDSSCSKP